MRSKMKIVRVDIVDTIDATEKAVTGQLYRGD